MSEKIAKFLLHYGISAVLLVMLAAIMYMLQVLKIDEKAAVDLIWEHNGGLYCYIPRSSCPVISGDSLEISTYEGRKLTLSVKETEEGQAFTVCRVELCEGQGWQTIFARGRKVTGYLGTGRKKLGELVFSKWFDKLH